MGDAPAFAIAIVGIAAGAHVAPPASLQAAAVPASVQPSLLVLLSPLSQLPPSRLLRLLLLPWLLQVMPSLHPTGPHRL